MSEADDHGRADPVRQARRLSAPPKLKRFYSKAEMAPEDGVYALRLDGKRANTPGRNALCVRDPRVADVIAREWTDQGEFIDPSSMPMTRLVNSAIDGVAAHMAEVADSVAAYAASDLLCYRAGEPDPLVKRQSAAWDPVIAWAEKQFRGRFILAQGVGHVAQPPQTLEAIRREVAGYQDPLRLAALQLATTLSGSAVLALALAAGEIGVDQAWAAAHVDEDWNISQWGEDVEASQRRSNRFADFAAAALALAPPDAAEGTAGL